jgi:hypothetical protein
VYIAVSLIRLYENKGYVGPIRKANNLIRPQLRPIKNLWADLKRKVYSNNFRPKYVKCLMAKIRKELKSIETTGVCKAIQEVLEKA